MDTTKPDDPAPSGKPILYNFGFSYPADTTNPETKAAIDNWKSWAPNLSWDSVSFLFESRDSTGEFLYDFGWAADWVKRAQEEYPDTMNGYDSYVVNTGYASSVVSKMKEAAAINLITHGGLMPCTDTIITVDTTVDMSTGDMTIGFDTSITTKSVGLLYLGDYKEKLVADSRDRGCNFCQDGFHPLRLGCYGAISGSKFLDHVLIAVVVGCNSGVGEPSIKDALLEYGVDCVVSTDRRNQTLFMLFWNRNFWWLTHEQTVSEAIINAYEESLEQMRVLYRFSSRDELIEAAVDQNGHYTIARSASETMQATGERSVVQGNIYPARSGE